MGEIESLREDIKDISKRLQEAETTLKVEEATRSERHQSMIERFERLEARLDNLEEQMSNDMAEILRHINALQELATQGKTSLRTLWVIGGIVTGGLALLASWLR